MEQKHVIQRIVKDIRNDDTFIEITGYIKKVINDNQIILDDTTGEIKVTLEDIDLKFKVKDLVNIIGDLNYNVEGEKSLNARMIQDMNNLNFKYYLKIYELKKEFI